MEPQIVEKEAFTVVGMQIRARPMDPAIPQLWDRFVLRMDEIPGVSEPGVTYGLMGAMDQETGTFHYMAGCAAAPEGALPAGMSRWEVPASTYAVFQATLPTLGDVFAAIYQQWLPASGYQPGGDFCFECYDETFHPDDPAATLFIYIPVTSRGSS